MRHSCQRKNSRENPRPKIGGLLYNNHNDKKDMTNLETLLAILTALSGLGNLAQWSNIKALRAKSRYEAEGVHVEVLNSTIKMQADEIQRLQERVRQLEEREKQREQEFEAKIEALKELYKAAR